MKYTKLEIENKVKQMIVDQVGVTPYQITEEKDLITDLGMDSLDCVELALTIEEEFGVSIPEAKANEARTVGNVFKMVEEIVNLGMDAAAQDEEGCEARRKVRGLTQKGESGSARDGEDK